MNAPDSADASKPLIERHIQSGAVCCDSAWEAAYKRFESPEEEIQKFIKRLKFMRLEDRPRDIRIVELFCGRGGGLVALQRLGFTKMEGVDLSETLLLQNQTGAKLHLAEPVSSLQWQCTWPCCRRGPRLRRGRCSQYVAAAPLP